MQMTIFKPSYYTKTILDLLFCEYQVPQSHTVCAQQNMNSNEYNAKRRVASHQENLERLKLVTENANHPENAGCQLSQFSWKHSEFEAHFMRLRIFDETPDFRQQTTFFRQ